MRVVKKKSIASLPDVKVRILTWAQQFEEVAWMDSNSFEANHSSYQAILAVDAFTSIRTDHFNAFEKLEEYQRTAKDWIFGYLTYDLKNDVENLSSSNDDGLAFPDLQFFQPKKIFFFSETEVEIQYLNVVSDELESDWETIENTTVPEAINTNDSVKIRLRTTKDDYFEKVGRMLKHIERGDIYEANFCQEFYAEATGIDPLSTFFHLNEISRPPFATFLKLSQLYALSASPERYLKKTGNTVISQPIKGTAKRLPNPSEDQKMAEALQNDPKERSENIMITDLVRNDLSRIAKKGTVEVEELCKIYTFEQVHQMISTIRCEVKASVSPVEIIKNSFPMGSMTGAPKVSAMKIIETLEDAKRGLYSGAVGYFTPTGDFDFNVVIRSILYNEAKKYVSFSVGGAITAKSVPENEYEECLLKAQAMRTVLET
ncbi:aminodeoxychorismate synthase component I [Marixanthomonas spongiae]|uniref:aminodeoxychorismate synthase n=1 Tax=Marixanthomonas spongiae TaxID=2174845 RepID=A0A2U0I3Q1_9FLAO|nr:aminodeoxychorismate synthase component I [Marixanthomonas spongiae]PVW15718.1 aminodeoxychorismate synthase component I [Marixanthomonas spongiae]